MKKRELLLFSFMLITALFIISGAAAQNASNATTTPVGVTTGTAVSAEGVKKAEQCLEEQIKKTVSLQEATFAMLALGMKQNLDDKIKSEESGGCWPKAGCTIKETAQVGLAYNRIGRSTKNIESWLTARNSSTTDLAWYLQIDIQSRVAAQCTLVYDGKENKIRVRDDAKIEGTPGTCFSISPSGYWLEVKSGCFDKKITISCDQDFITSTLYQRSLGGTVYVSPETHSASSLGTTEEEVRSKCFKIETTCDYEGSLWAALLLFKTGNKISDYLPYLLSFAESNDKFFPSTFLYILTRGDDQYSKIVQSQKQGKFWEISGTPYNRYYDTSLAMLALSTASSAELENARNYLLSIQTKEGCWNNNNVRDTGFILYSGWPKTVASETRETGAAVCVTSGYSCASKFSCLDAGGKVLDGYECESFGDSCCSIKIQEETCEQKNGILCSSSQQCSGSEVSSAEGSCCLGACQEVQVENICELTGVGTCRFSCESGEAQSDESCGASGKICCKTAEKRGGLLWLWILLIILIIAAVLGIIYRNKVKVWVYKIRGKATTKPVPAKSYTPALPPRPIPLGMPRPIIPRPSPAPARPSAPKDREMEETLRKLREMSK